MTERPESTAPEAADDAPGSPLDVEVAALLRAANEAYSSGLNEARAWDNLMRRRKRMQHAPLYAALAGAAGLALGLAWLNHGAGGGPVAVTKLEAEPVVAVKAEASTARPAKADLDQTADEPPPEQQRRPAPRSERVVAPAPPVSENDCRELIQGSPKQAWSCFGRLARDGDLQAEVALLQQARLSVQRLGDAVEGLSLLNQHATRFPNSPLRGEVAQLRVIALFDLGRNEQALSESEAALAAPWGRALAGELRWLRGRIYEERLGNCRDAVIEYAVFVGQNGARADEAEWRRASCLERSGRSAEARAAFSRYLGRSSPKHEDEARARLQALGTRAGPEAP